MCVCVYVCMYVCSLCMYVCVCVYVCMCVVCMHVCVCACACHGGGRDCPSPRCETRDHWLFTSRWLFQLTYYSIKQTDHIYPHFSNKSRSNMYSIDLKVTKTKHLNGHTSTVTSPGPPRPHLQPQQSHGSQGPGVQRIKVGGTSSQSTHPISALLARWAVPPALNSIQFKNALLAREI